MLLFMCLLSINYSEAARILAVVPTPSYSHQVVFQPIWKELSLRGHEVVTITPDPINEPALVNLTEINVHGAYDVWNTNIVPIVTEDFFTSGLLLIKLLLNLEHYVLSHPEVQNVIKNESSHYDVVLAESTMLSLIAFGQKFQAPVVSIISFEVIYEQLIIMGNPTHWVLYPRFTLPVHQNLSFKERIYSVLFEVIAILIRVDYFNTQDVNVKKYFGDDYPPVEEMLKNISLVLTNSDPILHKPKALLPTVIEFGGGSYRLPSKPLPNNLQQILDAAQEGFIYFSLGSNVKSVFLTEETRSILLKTFAELPYTVLWKYENDTLPNKPNNVVIAKWLPQLNVLKHPNIKLFINQGGLQSIEEATYNYIPMLIMPFYFDQHFNAYKMEDKGCALSIDYKTMKKETLKESILELINNSKYKNRLRKLASLAQDQPMNGIDKAVWWIEYVIRHKGTAHLRSPYLDMPEYQYYYLDVLAFFTVVSTVFIYAIFVVVKIILQILKKLHTSKTKLN